MFYFNTEDRVLTNHDIEVKESHAAFMGMDNDGKFCVDNWSENLKDIVLTHFI